MSLVKDIAKYKPRKEQSEALDFIKKAYESDNSTKFFLLNMPVGSGKSHLALMIADWYKSDVNKLSKIDVITNSKILQDQYSNTYESICDLKGKENYECSQYSSSCAIGSELNKLNKSRCNNCPYNDARTSFLSGNISLTNFYLYILYSIHNPDVIKNRGSKVLIVDECHDLDDVMSDFISIRLSESILKKYKFPNEKNLISKLKTINNITQYIEYLENFLSDISDMIESIETTDNKITNRDLKIDVVLGNDSKIMRILTDLKQFRTKIDIFLIDYNKNSTNWVYETSFNEKTKHREISIEPIWASDYLDKYIFSNYDMVIMMSGTILDKDLFCRLNGLDNKKAVYYSIDSPFDVKNRQIYYMPLGKMSYKNKSETFKNYIPYIYRILKKYDTKGIIHTNSFELSKWIQESVNDSRLIFHDSQNKDDMLKLHMESIKPTVIVSPSMDTGVSFDDDYARFQIIAKIPYPSLASQKNKLRQKQYPDWYSWKTVAGFIQMTGRPVRSKSDYADTIVIDSSFGDILRYSSHFIPNWVTIAIKFINVK